MTLKPCPFCSETEMLVVMVEGSELGPDHYVYCASCACHGPRGSRAEAVKAWNKPAKQEA